MNGQSRTGASVFKAVALLWLAAGAVWVLMNYGAQGLLGAGIVALVAFASLRLGISEKRFENFESLPSRFGPSKQDVDLDPLFKMFSHNINHNKD